MAEQHRSSAGNTGEPDPGDDAPAAVSDQTPLRNLLSWVLIGLSIAVGLSAAGLWLARSQAPSPSRVEVIIPTPAPIVVHVLGAVNNPGVYTLPPGSRMADAIKAAGGPDADADLSRFNLAARAPDGARIHVPSAVELGTETPESGHDEATPGTAGRDSPAGPGGASTALVDLNTAPASVLTTLPGIGNKRADAIIAYRQTRGEIASVDDLLEIEGFGPATIESIRPFVAQSAADQSANQAVQSDATSDAAQAFRELVDLNTGSLSALMSLPGIGESRAGAIIRYRELNGPIESVDALLEIDGIGRATVDNIRPFVVQR